MSTINERIKSLVDHFSKGNNSDFANRIGINEANVRNYIANTEPKFNVLEKIANNFEINFEWLLTGKGEMLKKEESEKRSTAIKVDKNKTIDYMPKVIVVDRYEEGTMLINEVKNEMSQVQLPPNESELIALLKENIKDKETIIKEKDKNVHLLEEKIKQLEAQLSTRNSIPTGISYTGYTRPPVL